MEQGAHSFIKEKDGRIYKHIYDVDAYGSTVYPYQECRILQYVSKLGTEFPQNVICEDAYMISYDKTVGTRLDHYIKLNDPLSIEKQKHILSQILNSYYKLFKVGFVHGDPNLGNYIIDNDGLVHIIDFGFAYSDIKYRSLIRGKIIEVFDEEYEEYDLEYIEPVEQYEDLLVEADDYNFLPILEDLIEDFIDLLDESLYYLLMENIDDLDRIKLILL